MKYLIMALFSFLFASSPKLNAQIPSSIYDFKVPSLDGGTIDFSQFKGKKILIVNTASKCGFTKQYAELEELYKTYGANLVIVGFPANNFLHQEPGTNKDIASFCQKNFGVSFPMAAKISVKGKDMAPIYQWLTKKDYNKVESSSIKWNFQKYLIDESGHLVRHFAPPVTPMSDEIVNLIK